VLSLTIEIESRCKIKTAEQPSRPPFPFADLIEERRLTDNHRQKICAMHGLNPKSQQKQGIPEEWLGQEIKSSCQEKPSPCQNRVSICRTLIIKLNIVNEKSAYSGQRHCTKI
jgi:hypothetical protein